jgi:hypothetical protein
VLGYWVLVRQTRSSPLSRPFGSRYLGFMKVSIKLSKANRISSIHLIHSCIHSMILAHFLLKSNAPTSHSLQLHTMNPPRCVFRTCVQTHLSSNSNKQPPLYTQTQNTHKQTNKGVERGLRKETKVIGTRFCLLSRGCRLREQNISS